MRRTAPRSGRRFFIAARDHDLNSCNIVIFILFLRKCGRRHGPAEGQAERAGKINEMPIFLLDCMKPRPYIARS